MARLSGGHGVREATEDDAGRIAQIYNQGIADRLATFETTLRSEAAVVTALRERKVSGHPVVVFETGASVVAFAWASRYPQRDCYEGVAEFSVYVSREARGLGHGRRVLKALVTECEARGTWKLVSRVFPENGASLALCRALGFREVGTYRRHAQLDGQWRDCVVVEKLLGPAAG